MHGVRGAKPKSESPLTSATELEMRVTPFEQQLIALITRLENQGLNS